jgi:carboxymethylenebutenolidase
MTEAPEIVALQAASGARCTAAVAVGPDARDAGLIVVPDGGAPPGAAAALAGRFAAAGHHAVAIDHDGRAAEAAACIPAAQALLALRTGSRRAVIAGVGSGGVLALLAAADPALSLAGAIAVCTPLRGVGSAILDRAPVTRTPVLAIFCGAGAAAHEDVAALAAGLGTAGVDHELVTHAGAPFAGDPVEHADVWRRILEFLEPLALHGVA